jgi:hypothetical protein
MADKTKAHTIYKTEDGKRVPGVTTILGILNKPALVKWANNLGLNGIDSSKYVDDKADIGKCCHYMIECDIKGVDPDLSDYSPNTVTQAENGFLKWLDWKSQHTITDAQSEIALVSEHHRYGGTIDIYALVDGKWTLLDIKTSGSGIYPEMKHQVAGGYRYLLIEHGYPVDECRILRVGRTDDEGFEECVIGNAAAHAEVFMLCRKLYEARKWAK